MQVHAFDQKRLVSSQEAKRGKDYFCPECLCLVRLRKGSIRSSHFFHLKKNRLCRQSQKGIIHIKLQETIQSFFEDAKMEMAFPTIGRIADVACPSSKIVYEIQYSPMSAEEAKARCLDYASIGYTVVWILHDHTFNNRRKTPVEKFLRASPCYYSNFNEKGEGIIYDELEGSPFHSPVNLKTKQPLPHFKWPQELQNRADTWPFHHEGDLIDLALNGLLPTRQRRGFLKTLKTTYLGLLHMALERSSK